MAAIFRRCSTCRSQLQSWEPAYALATYTDAGAEFPMPGTSPDVAVGLDRDRRPHDAERLDDDVDLAVRQLVEPWLVSSNGHLDVACVEGDVGSAIGALGVRRARIARLDAAEALAWIAWAGASGGAHGRRRGAAAGRFGAWWLLATIGDLVEQWPVRPDELGALAAELAWYRWDAHEPTVGWSLQIAVADEANGTAWAINARDAV